MRGRERSVGIIGAGIGGLVAAISLARLGHRVVLCEADAAPGGKLRRIPLGQGSIEIGPAALTLRPVFAQIFAEAGQRLEDHLSLTPRDAPVRHVFADGSVLDLPMAEEAAAEAIARFAGPAEARGYRAFRARARAAFATLEESLLKRARPTALGLASQAGVARLLATGPFTTLWDALGEHFRDPRLRQLFARTAGYVGSSPLQAPATLMLVADVEHQGSWWVEGGMSRLAFALAELARAAGVELRLDTRVAEILAAGGRVSGLRLDSGETLACDAVVANADPAALAAGRLGATAARAVAAVPVMKRSFSALLWAMEARIDAPDLPAETVLHGADPAAEYGALAWRGRLPADPSITLLAPGTGRLLAMIHAPARGDSGQPDGAALAAAEANVLARLGRLGITPGVTQRIGPTEFEAMFPGTGGALYGQAVQGWQATFSRPSSRTKLAGLYLAGGGTHPGAGVAMAALSGRLAAAEISGG